ncbi:MAG: peptide deformylase [Candidatus Krumholzibacteria bacterium]|nr:peptide deformylase [Candidatus Krumholzibacteria bacterium]
MSKLEIKIYGDKVLRSKSESVKEFGSELAPFLEEMVETMIVEGGVGLAAPQVGISKRMVIVNPDPHNSETLIRLVNPRIILTSSEKGSLEEGCLSIPGIRGNVARSSAVEVQYQDDEGRECNLSAEGLLARIIQHEIDHLEGTLFIDYLSLAKKAMIKPKLRSLMNRSNGEK